MLLSTENYSSWPITKRLDCFLRRTALFPHHKFHYHEYPQSEIKLRNIYETVNVAISFIKYKFLKLCCRN